MKARIKRKHAQERAAALARLRSFVRQGARCRDEKGLMALARGWARRGYERSAREALVLAGKIAGGVPTVGAMVLLGHALGLDVSPLPEHEPGPIRYPAGDRQARIEAECLSVLTGGQVIAEEDS